MIQSSYDNRVSIVYAECPRVGCRISHEFEKDKLMRKYIAVILALVALFCSPLICISVIKLTIVKSRLCEPYRHVRTVNDYSIYKSEEGFIQLYCIMFTIDNALSVCFTCAQRISFTCWASVSTKLFSV